MSNTIGTVLINVGADVSKLVSGFEKADREAKKRSQSIVSYAKGITGALAGIASVSAFNAVIRGSIDAADATGKLADKMGIAVKDFSRLEYSAGQTGVSVKGLESAFGAMIRRTTNFKRDGGGAAAKAMNELGVSTEFAQEHFTDTNTTFEILIERLRGVEDKTLRTALAQDIFSKSAADVVLLAGTSAESLSALADEGERSGAVISDEFARASADFNDNMETMGQAASGLSNEMAAGMLPSLSQGAQILTPLLQDATHWLHEFIIQAESLQDINKKSGLDTLEMQLEGINEQISSIESPKTALDYIGNALQSEVNQNAELIKLKAMKAKAEKEINALLKDQESSVRGITSAQKTQTSGLILVGESFDDLTKAGMKFAKEHRDLLDKEAEAIGKRNSRMVEATGTGYEKWLDGISKTMREMAADGHTDIEMQIVFDKSQAEFEMKAIKESLSGAVDFGYAIEMSGDKAKVEFEDWGKTLNSSISNAAVSALQSRDVKGAITGFGSSIFASMIQASVANLSAGGTQLDAAGGAASMGGVYGIVAGMALSSITSSLFGGEKRSPQEEANKNLERFSNKLEDATRGLDVFGNSGSDLKISIEETMAEIKMIAEEWVLKGDTREEVFTYQSRPMFDEFQQENIITMSDQISQAIFGIGDATRQEFEDMTDFEVTQATLNEAHQITAKGLMDDLSDKINAELASGIELSSYSKEQARKLLAKVEIANTDESIAARVGFTDDDIKIFRDYEAALTDIGIAHKLGTDAAMEEVEEKYRGLIVAGEVATSADIYTSSIYEQGKNFEELIDIVDAAGESVAESNNNISIWEESLKSSDDVLSELVTELGIVDFGTKTLVNMYGELAASGDTLSDSEMAVLAGRKQQIDLLKQWEDSFKTPTQLAAEMARELGVNLAESMNDLTATTRLLSNDTNGLTQEDYKFLTTIRQITEARESERIAMNNTWTSLLQNVKNTQAAQAAAAREASKAATIAFYTDIVGNAQNRINSTKDVISGLNSDVSSSLSAVNTLTSAIESSESGLASIADQIAATKISITEQMRVDAIAAQNAQIEAHNDSINARITATEETRSILSGQISELESSRNSLESALTGMAQTLVSNAQSAHADIANEVSVLEQTRDTQIAALEQQEKDSISSAIGDLNDTLSDLSSSMSALDGLSDSLRSRFLSGVNTQRGFDAIRQTALSASYDPNDPSSAAAYSTAINEYAQVSDSFLTEGNFVDKSAFEFAKASTAGDFAGFSNTVDTNIIALENIQKAIEYDVAANQSQLAELNEQTPISEHDLALTQSQLENMRLQLATAEANLASITAQMDPIIGTEEASLSALSELQRQIAIDDRQLSVLRSELSTAESTLLELEKQIQPLLSTETAQVDSLTQLKAQLAEQEASYGTQQQQLSQQQAEYAQASSALASAQNSLAAQEGILAQQEHELATAQENLEAVQAVEDAIDATKEGIWTLEAALFAGFEAQKIALDGVTQAVNFDDMTFALGDDLQSVISAVDGTNSILRDNELSIDWDDGVADLTLSFDRSGVLQNIATYTKDSKDALNVTNAKMSAMLSQDLGISKTEATKLTQIYNASNSSQSFLSSVRDATWSTSGQVSQMRGDTGYLDNMYTKLVGIDQSNTSTKNSMANMLAGRYSLSSDEASKLVRIYSASNSQASFLSSIKSDSSLSRVANQSTAGRTDSLSGMYRELQSIDKESRATKTNAGDTKAAVTNQDRYLAEMIQTRVNTATTSNTLGDVRAHVDGLESYANRIRQNLYNQNLHWNDGWKTLPKYADGGYTGAGSKYEIAGITHRDEFVLSKENVTALGGPKVIESFRDGGLPIKIDAPSWNGPQNLGPLQSGGLKVNVATNNNALAGHLSEVVKELKTLRAQNKVLIKIINTYVKREKSKDDERIGA